MDNLTPEFNRGFKITVADLTDLPPTPHEVAGSLVTSLLADIPVDKYRESVLYWRLQTIEQERGLPDGISALAAYNSWWRAGYDRS